MIEDMILKSFSTFFYTISGRQVMSVAFHDDVDMIVDMEVRLRLLELGDAPTSVPIDPPPLPLPPRNYEFCEESSA